MTRSESQLPTTVVVLIIASLAVPAFSSSVCGCVEQTSRAHPKCYQCRCTEDCESKAQVLNCILSQDQSSPSCKTVLRNIYSQQPCQGDMLGFLCQFNSALANRPSCLKCLCDEGTNCMTTQGDHSLLLALCGRLSTSCISDDATPPSLCPCATPHERLRLPCSTLHPCATLKCILSQNVSSVPCMSALNSCRTSDTLPESCEDLSIQSITDLRTIATDSTRSTTDLNTEVTSMTSASNKDSDQILVYSLAIAVPASIVVLLLLVSILVILALYWRFRPKLLRERNTTLSTNTSYNVRTAANYYEDDDDPLYSVPDSTPHPPQLPTGNRVPYYQEIESDIVGGAAADYERPLPQLQIGRDINLDMMEPYQEPIDALRIEGETFTQQEKKTEDVS